MLSTRVDGGLVAPLVDFISASDQGLRNVYFYGQGTLPTRFYLLIRKVFPGHLGKCTLAIVQPATVERVVVASTRLRVSIMMVGRAGWNMIDDPLRLDVVPSKLKRESRIWERSE